MRTLYSNGRNATYYVARKCPLSSYYITFHYKRVVTCTYGGAGYDSGHDVVKAIIKEAICFIHYHRLQPT